MHTTDTQTKRLLPCTTHTHGWTVPHLSESERQAVCAALRYTMGATDAHPTLAERSALNLFLGA